MTMHHTSNQQRSLRARLRHSLNGASLPLSLISIALSVALAAGCTNMSHLVPAKPLPTGETRVMMSHGAVITPSGTMFAADVAVRHGVTDWFNFGARVGFPHGLSVNGLLNIVASEYVSVSVDPMVNINWWMMGNNLNHTRLELPLLVGFHPAEDIEITLTGGWGFQAYWEPPERDGYNPTTAQYVTGQLAAKFPLNHRVSIMPYFAYAYFFKGLRPGGPVHMSAGFAVELR